MSEKDGGSAFPVLDQLITHDRAADHTMRFTAESVGGMTLRDYFAGQALVGWLADSAMMRIIRVRSVDIPTATDELANHCYGMADAMLKAREQS